MKCCYTTANGRLTFEFESDTEKKLFAELAHIQEIFEETKCGCCDSDRIRFEVREFDKNKYYKLVCSACGATLDYHQKKEGETLYLKDAERATKTRGWYRYKDAEKPPAATPAPSTNRTTTPAAASNSKGAAQRPAQQATGHQKSPFEAHKEILAALPRVRSKEQADRWAEYAKGFDFTPGQEDEQSDAYHAAMERLGLLEAAGDIRDKEIPF